MCCSSHMKGLLFTENDEFRIPQQSTKGRLRCLGQGKPDKDRDKAAFVRELLGTLPLEMRPGLTWACVVDLQSTGSTSHSACCTMLHRCPSAHKLDCVGTGQHLHPCQVSSWGSYRALASDCSFKIHISDHCFLHSTLSW